MGEVVRQFSSQFRAKAASTAEVCDVESLSSFRAAYCDISLLYMNFKIC